MHREMSIDYMEKTRTMDPEKPKGNLHEIGVVDDAENKEMSRKIYNAVINGTLNDLEKDVLRHQLTSSLDTILHIVVKS